ncbi:MAG TPA: hypothetical protein VH702_02760 [Vicinamibacterales bacterium]
MDGQPISGVTVKIGSQTAVSDSSGAYQMENPGSGPLTATLTAPSVVERRTVVTMQAGESLRQSLIPSSFDLVAFDEMFRTDNRLRRWTNAPALVVLTSVLNYTRGLGHAEEYYATSEQLTDAETALLIEQLTEALGLLTGNTYRRFSSVQRESVPEGSRVSPLREGKIVVGRYDGVEGILNTIGFGQWQSDETGQVVGGAIYLDKDFDKKYEARRLLRTHELGHALGYNHVNARVSIMNPAIGPEPTIFDRQGPIIAFQRMPGNQTPDTDPGAAPSGGGIFGVVADGSSASWSGPIICAPRVH